MAKNERDPLSDTVQECIGSFDVTATFEKDESTLALLKNVEGLVAFICTLKRNGEVISQGRGSAIVNRKSRFIDRAVSTAFGSAFVDASVRSAKVLDTLRPSAEKSENDTFPEETEDRPMSEKQKSLLISLISENVADNDERERSFQEVETLSMSDASEMIASFLAGARR